MAHRSQAAHQANLVLVVMTDGDRFGVVARKASLDDELANAGQRPRQSAERIAYLVPTWSIETWLAWLCGAAGDLEGFDEAKPYKNDNGYRRAADRGVISTKKAATAWTAPLPARAPLSRP
jgi:hypothetical protein